MLDYVDEIASDLSAFHRVDDWRTVDPWRFFALVDQLAAYRGALRGRLERERAEPSSGAAVASPEAALADLVAAGIVSWKR